MNAENAFFDEVNQPLETVGAGLLRDDFWNEPRLSILKKHQRVFKSKLRFSPLILCRTLIKN